LCFAEDITTTKTAKIVVVHRNTVNSYFKKIREKIFKQCLSESTVETGEFKLNESYFGTRRVRGKRGRGAAGKSCIWLVEKKRRGILNCYY
jgi:transposase-like protein